ncbi:glycosyltransferase family 4 protein [Endozoicomonas sp. 8E]|uniref:glycosyltransferase family 4 protein n=1 Tax=Endozoicomonas sp. 8E TaxID=3035692 RepID=UPI002938D2F6|nr:glycosyltransferase family 4 protein [Endozoicomonas sp. 8E]WOG25815.1 glycosyltransferase family 4 protein [Endozoicomonas sp. 8E]
MKKILIVGSLPPPYHGQSICLDSTLKALSDQHCKTVNTSFRNTSVVKSCLNAVEYFLKLPIVIILFKPDIVYFTCSRTKIGFSRDLYLLFLCFFSKAKVYNHLHGSDFKEFYRPLNACFKSLLRAAYSRVNKHAVLVDEMKEQLNDIKGNATVSVIHNFYKDHPSIFEAKRGKASNSLKILYLSSIVKSKGVFELIDAVKYLNDKGANLTLTIAGGFLGDQEYSGKEIEDKLRSDIKGFDYINYVGVVGSEEKYNLLSQADVFSLPSYYRSEAVPLSIIEAMRMGCLILTTKYKYLPSIVKDGVNGYLVETRSVIGIAEKLEFIISNMDVLNNISSCNSSEAIDRYSEKKYQANVRSFLGV